MINLNFDIYTDGSHKGKWGSWAFVIVQNNLVIYESSGRVRKTDSHRMEFQAVIEALNYLGPGIVANVHTDSRALIKTMSQFNLKTFSNSDQIFLLKQMIDQIQLTWTWVKAHSGVPFNERCDQLCSQARLDFLLTQ